jgi:hypothetical protein
MLDYHGIPFGKNISRILQKIKLIPILFVFGFSGNKNMALFNHLGTNCSQSERTERFSFLLP